MQITTKIKLLSGGIVLLIGIILISLLYSNIKSNDNKNTLISTNYDFKNSTGSNLQNGIIIKESDEFFINKVSGEVNYAINYIDDRLKNENDPKIIQLGEEYKKRLKDINTLLNTEIILNDRIKDNINLTLKNYNNFFIQE